MPCVPYFYPARDGGAERRLSPVFVPRWARRPHNRTEKLRPGRRPHGQNKPTRKNKQETLTRARLIERRNRSTNHNTPGPPAERTTQPSARRARREQRSRCADRDEDDHDCNPRGATTTNEEQQPDCDYVRACATCGELADSGQNSASDAHPDCDVASVLTRRDENVVKGDPACDTQLERIDEIGEQMGDRAVPEEGCRCLANPHRVETR